MIKHIPNIITLSNLTCGILSIIHAGNGSFEWAAYFIFIGLFFDFFDGFFARILKVDGEIGKQLDSLADMVTFGVAPGLLLYYFSNFLIFGDYLNVASHDMQIETFKAPLYISYICFIIPILSAVRLAKFNISTNQSDEFIGFPTPANAIFFASSIILLNSYFMTSIGNGVLDRYDYEVIEHLNSTVLWTQILILISIPLSLLLNAKIPLIALKFKTFDWIGNEARFILLGVSVLVILGSLLISNIFVATPIIILLYLIISVINNITKRAK